MIEFSAIQEGLVKGEFFLEYQPVCSLKSNHCVGAEALIRWRRGSTVLLPDKFIPSVENTPLAGLLTYWVIETVGREMGFWLRANAGVHISINVPPEILGRGGIAYAATKAGLMDVAHKIVFEVTERGVPDKLGLQALTTAGRYGVQVALDDVGLADENLAVFSRAHIDILKIDKSLVDQLRDEDERPQWLEALSALLRVTPLQVIVEGVESEGQVEKLKEAGIELAQGLYFSPPLAIQAFLAFARTRREQTSGLQE
jgi:sensor c-di-GMP phosphodiesterase-like protein